MTGRVKEREAVSTEISNKTRRKVYDIVQSTALAFKECWISILKSHISVFAAFKVYIDFYTRNDRYGTIAVSFAPEKSFKH